MEGNSFVAIYTVTIGNIRFGIREARLFFSTNNIVGRGVESTMSLETIDDEDGLG